MSSTPPSQSSRYRFVLPSEGAWADLAGVPAAELPDAESVAHRFIDAVDVWVVQTYLRVARAGVDAGLADRFDPGAINVTSFAGLSLRPKLWKHFVVCAQHDRPRPARCHARVVQNKAGVKTEHDHYMPHWPQPGLKPRDPDRGDRIRTLCFKGALTNLGPAYRDPAFLRALEGLGVALDTSDRADKLARDAVDWTDYREADLVLAVRDQPPAKLDTKPPTKLINAWLAGTPALLGPESAYRQLRDSDLDYIEVRSPEDALEAVRALQADPARYRAMIEHGARRGAEFNAEATTRRWTDLLTGPIAEQHAAWRAAGPLARAARRPGHLAAGLRHALNVRAHRRAQREA